MSIELPAVVVAVSNVIGLPWPEVDEDQLRGWAGDLRGFAAEITALAGDSRQAVAAVAAGSESVFVQMLAGQWARQHQVIEDLRGPMEVFAGALDGIYTTWKHRPARPRGPARTAAVPLPGHPGGRMTRPA